MVTCPFDVIRMPILVLTLTCKNRKNIEQRKSEGPGPWAELSDNAAFDQRIEKALVAKLEGIFASEFVHIDYGEAIQVLERANEKFEFSVKWGIDPQSEHERYLTEKYAKKPVIVMNYPKAIKAFYMRVNDDGRTVAAMDVLAPRIGEIIGGSQRGERLEVLDRSMAERGIDGSTRPHTGKPRSSGGAQRLGAFDPLSLTRTVHRLPQIAAPLHVQPEVGAVAEFARQDERGRRRHAPAIVAQFVDVLALNPHGLGERGLGQLHWLHELLDKNFTDRGRFTLRRQHRSPHR